MNIRDTRVIRAFCSLLASHSLDSVVVVRLPGGIEPVPTPRIERHYDLCWNYLDDMQTIKCIVVGDGAVGKVRDGSSLGRVVVQYQCAHCADLSFDIVHNQQISYRVCPDCAPSLPSMFYLLGRCEPIF